MTLSRLEESFLITLANRNTREAYRRALSQFKSFIGKEVANADDHDIRSYSHNLASVSTLSTVNLRLSGLRAYFAWLVDQQIVRANPATSVALRHVGAGEQHSNVTADMVRQKLAQIPVETKVGPDVIAMRDRALIAVLLSMGISISRALGLLVGHVTVVGDRLVKVSEEAMPGEESSYLLEYLAARKRLHRGGAGLLDASPLFPMTLRGQYELGRVPLRRENAYATISGRLSTPNMRIGPREILKVAR